MFDAADEIVISGIAFHQHRRAFALAVIHDGVDFVAIEPERILAAGLYKRHRWYGRLRGAETIHVFNDVLLYLVEVRGRFWQSSVFLL